MVMQKNWYVLYTRPQCEKKVAALLTKKKIENFIPLVTVESQKSWRNKLIHKPLFNAYVFVHVTQEQVGSLIQMDGVINILHWLGRAAIISDAEVNSIKEFTVDCQNITLEKLAINTNLLERNIYKSSFEIEGNLIAVMNKTIKINLPSLGYAMIANLKEDSVFGRQRSMAQKYTFAQS